MSHLAAIVGHRPCDANPSLAIETNVNGTAMLAECPLPSVRVKEQLKERDRRNYRVAFGKLHDLLGFQPSKQLTDGIREIIHATRNGFLTNADYENSNLTAINRLVGGAR